MERHAGGSQSIPTVKDGKPWLAQATDKAAKHHSNTTHTSSREEKPESRGVPRRVARGSWSHEDRDEEQLAEDRRWCQCRGLAAMQKKHSAARAWSTEQRPDRSRRLGQGRQRSSQAGEGSPEATMKHPGCDQEV